MDKRTEFLPLFWFNHIVPNLSDISDDRLLFHTLAVHAARTRKKYVK